MINVTPAASQSTDCTNSGVAISILSLRFVAAFFSRFA
jgi:hypothetical protein